VLWGGDLDYHDATWEDLSDDPAEGSPIAAALAKAERTAKATGCVKRIESDLYDCI
jgi:hypothetical protein